MASSIGVPISVRVSGRIVGLFILVGCATGCAHSDSVADRHVNEMRGEISKLEAEQDRENSRLDLLELTSDDLKAEQSPNAIKPSRGAAAPPAAGAQHTIQIGEDDEGREGEDPNDPNARPEIHLQGQPGAAQSTRPLRGKSVRGGSGDHDSRADDDANRADNISRASILDPDAKKAYDAAIGQVNGKQYDRALESLNAFLVHWPDHPYVENAMYWRGECYYAKGEYLRAAEQFEAVIARFGGGSKAPDALLKIGMCQDRLGASDRAKEYWDRLKREYPSSAAAKRIPGTTTTTTTTGTGTGTGTGSEGRGPQK